MTIRYYIYGLVLYSYYLHMPIYTSYWPNEDNTTTLVYDFIADSDQEAIELVNTGDISFCDVEEIESKQDYVTIFDDTGRCIYNNQTY